MLIKRHLSGYHVAYSEYHGGAQKYSCGVCLVISYTKEPCPVCGVMMTVKRAEGRKQGSHYNQQKKRIADAVAYLQQIRRPDCQPLVFVATSPGFVDRANEPRFISKLVDNLKKGYYMENYVWVREFTGNGYPHFHFIANIPLKKKPHTIQNTPVPFDPVRLSVTWSKYFGSDARNSIRVGSKPNKHGKRMLYLTNSRRKAWYLAKYIGKSRSDDEIRSGAKVKGFHMDEKTSRAIEPELFKGRYLTETKAMSVWNAHTRKFETEYYDIPTGQRVFENEKGELLVAENINWRKCGSHEVWVGFEKD